MGKTWQSASTAKMARCTPISSISPHRWCLGGGARLNHVPDSRSSDQSMKRTAPPRNQSACLLQHPAVAYLRLVRCYRVINCLRFTQEHQLHLRIFSITCFRTGPKLNGDLAEAVSA